MSIRDNPYLKDMIDEATGHTFPNDRYSDWQAGYLAAIADMKLAIFRAEARDGINPNVMV